LQQLQRRVFVRLVSLCPYMDKIEIAHQDSVI